MLIHRHIQMQKDWDKGYKSIINKYVHLVFQFLLHMLPLQTNAFVPAMLALVVNELKPLSRKFMKLILHCVGYCRSFHKPLTLQKLFWLQKKVWRNEVRAVGPVWDNFSPFFSQKIHFILHKIRPCIIHMQLLTVNVNTHEDSQGFYIVRAIYIFVFGHGMYTDHILFIKKHDHKHF